MGYKDILSCPSYKYNFLSAFSLFQMYGEEFEEQEEETLGCLGEHESKKEKKTGRKASEQGHGSPLKRKESFARRDK